MNYVANKNTPINFEARIRLSDKGLLNLPQKTEILYSASPMDFFYKESKTKKRLDALSIRIKDRIRKEQKNPDNSQLKSKILKKSFVAANKLRSVASKILMFENIKSFYKTFQLLRKLNPSSPNYIEEWAKLGNSIHNKYINMNIESGRIEEIAKSNDSVVFILNHDNVERDKFIYPIFNSFLNYAYSAFGKQKDCPRPNIIVSKNFFQIAGNRFKHIYHKMGLIPVDASMTDRNFEKNISPVRQLISRFSDNKCNIFIFPEGNNSVYKNRTLKEKFQPGIAKMIDKILDSKSSVNVVPLGLSYNSAKDSMGSVHIGSTLTFNKISENIYFMRDSGKLENIGKLGNRSTVKNIMQILCSNLEENVKLSKLDN